jgi:sugar (pentulose or hexulose) kinase
MSRGIAIDSSTTATKAVVCDRDRHAALRCADDGEH